MSVTGLERYWGLERPAFDEAPDPRALFLADSHEDALLLLHHFFARRQGLGLLTGEPGTGKTSVLRRVMGLLGSDLLGSLVEGGDPRSLRARVLVSLRRDPAEADLDGRLTEIHESGRKAIVAVDAATVGDLFELRELVAAHPELCALACGDDPVADALGPYGAVVTARLAPIRPEETSRLLAFRLRAAGYRREGLPFTEEAFAEIDARAAGIPRLAVRLAETALWWGMERGLTLLDGPAMREALRPPDFGLDPLPEPSPEHAPPEAASPEPRKAA